MVILIIARKKNHLISKFLSPPLSPSLPPPSLSTKVVMSPLSVDLGDAYVSVPVSITITLTNLSNMKAPYRMSTYEKDHNSIGSDCLVEFEPSQGALGPKGIKIFLSSFLFFFFYFFAFRN